MPWPQSARFRAQRVGAIPYQNNLIGTPNLFRLRNAGYLERVLLWHQQSFTIATAAPTGFDLFGQYTGPLGRIMLLANTSARIIDLSAVMAKTVTWLDSQYRYGSSPGVVAQPTTQASVGFPYVGPPDSFNSAPAPGSYTLGWYYDLPVALNLVNRPWPTGLFQLAVLAQETDLDIRNTTMILATPAGPGGSVYTGPTANFTFGSGLTEVSQVFYEPIAAPADQPSLNYVHQWTEMQVFITGDGDTEIRLPQNVLYLRLVPIYMEGATAAALAPRGWQGPGSQGIINRFRIVYGPNVTPIDLSPAILVARQTQMYGNYMAFGYFCIDLLEDTHTERDMLNAGATTDMRLTITTSGGSYAGGAYVKLGTEQLVPIPVSRSGQALAQGVAS